MKILGINSSAQPVQMTNAVITTLGNPYYGSGFSSTADQHGGIRTTMAFPNYNAGRIQMFILSCLDSPPAPQSGKAVVFTSFDGLVKLPITYTSGTFTKGHTITGSISGASGVISEDPTQRFSGNPTEIYVEQITSGPFQNGDVLSTSPGGAAGTVNSAPSTDSMGDAWKIETGITAGQVYVTRSICGLHPVAVGGITKLVAHAHGTSANYVKVYDPATDTWSGQTNVGSATTSYPRTVGIGTKLFVVYGTTRIVEFASGTPVSGSAIAPPTSYYAYTASICPINGDVYMSYVYNNSIIYVVKYVAGAWSAVGSISTGTTSLGNRTHLFQASDGYPIVIGSINGGAEYYRITSLDPFTYEDLTTPVNYIPAGFTSFINTPVFSVLDWSTNGPTGAPSVVVIFQNQSSGAISVLRCDDSHTWADLGSNTSGVTHHFGSGVDGAFDVTYEPGANLGILTGDVASVPGGQRFTYRPFGSGTVNFELLVQEGAISDAAVRGTLGSPSQGSLADGNKKITGVTADGNEKTAVWLGASDGFSDGDFVFRVPFIST